LLRHLGVGDRLSSEQESGPWDLEHGVDMALDSLVGPGKDWDDRKSLESSLFSVGFNFFDEPSLDPVLVSEEDALRGTFLAAQGVGVVVALPGDVVNLLEDSRPQYLPVKACVFDFDFSIGDLG